MTSPILAAFLLFSTPVAACPAEDGAPAVESLVEPIDAAFRASLETGMEQAHTRVLRWSEARKWIYAYHADGPARLQVWDVYGLKWMRGPGTTPEEMGLKEVNVEHTWPQSLFARGWDGVKTGNDEDALRGDLHNLFPTEIALNSARANKPFAEVGDCPPVQSCFDGAFFEPPDEQKGNSARAMFYMSARYGMAIPEPMEGVLRGWNTLDPVDEAEIARNGAIASIQGNRNPFIDDPALTARFTDF